MGGLHAPDSITAFFAGDLIAFTTGLPITVLLLVLTLRAAKLPGTPLLHIGFAACSAAGMSSGHHLTTQRRWPGYRGGRVL
jgi:hypothetical protein